jgi:DeoR/GlpR family transcriptional regulator of sugar metabolism
LKIGREVIIVADYSKINRVSTALLSPLNIMNLLVTDAQADKKFLTALKKNGIQIVIA